MSNKKEVRHLEESRNDLAQRYKDEKLRADRLAGETMRLEASVAALSAQNARFREALNDACECSLDYPKEICVACECLFLNTDLPSVAVARAVEKACNASSDFGSV